MGNDAAIPDDGTIEQQSLVLNHAIVAHGAAMHDDIGPDGDAVTDGSSVNRVRNMNRAVLAEIERVANRDQVAVTAQYGKRSQHCIAADRHATEDCTARIAAQHGPKLSR